MSSHCHRSVLVKSNLLLILFFSLSAFSQTASEKRQKIIKIINEEIKEVNRLSRQYKQKNPSVLFRKSELFLEKGRIIKEIENERYLDIPVKRRRKLKKKNYFKESYSLFLRARSVAQKLLKSFPGYDRSSDVYYILGFNEKEFGSNKKALEFLLKAERYAAPGSKSKIRAQNALAEIYYNQKKYRKAINYYEKNLQILKDRWWTKDAYNLSWSHFRIRNYERAIELMKKVEDLSQKSQYIDMSGQVEKDIGLFYAESGKIKEGVTHYKKYNKDYTLELITIATFLKEQGKYAQALSVLTEALKISKTDKNKVKILLARIQLFDKYEKSNYHLKDCIALYRLTKNYQLTKDQFEIFKYQLKRQVGKLQNQIASPTYKKSKAVTKRKIKNVVSYLALLKDLEPQKKDDTNFYMAETYYQGDFFDKAIDSYQAAFKEASKRGDKKIMKLSMEGMLSAIGQPKSKFRNRDKYIYPVFNSYLAYDSRSTKAKEIYKRLYRNQYEKKNTVEMKKLLSKYANLYPKDIKNQEKMINSLIELYNQKKQAGQLALLMSELSGGKYKISSKARKNLFSVYQKIEIKRVEQSLAKGNYSKAIEGYLKIYSNKKSTAKAKANAAYNLMAISLKGLKLQETYNWGLKASKLMTDKDFYAYRSSFLSVSKYLFERMQFTASADLSHRSLGKICKSKTKLKQQFFNNAVINYRAFGNVNKIKSLRRLVKICGLPTSSLVLLDKEVLGLYLYDQKYESLGLYIGSISGNKELHPELAMYSTLIYNYYNDKKVFYKLKEWQRNIQNYYKSSQRQNKKVPVIVLDAIANFNMGSIQRLDNQVDNIQLSFPEKVFNSRLQGKLQKLNALTAEALKIQKIGSGRGIVTAFEILVSSYLKVAEEINSFEPKGKSPQYIKSFKKSMRQLTSPLFKKARDFEKQAQRAISKNEILTEYESRYRNFSYNVKDSLKFYDYERLGR